MLVLRWHRLSSSLYFALEIILVHFVASVCVGGDVASGPLRLYVLLVVLPLPCLEHLVVKYKILTVFWLVSLLAPMILVQILASKITLQFTLDIKSLLTLMLTLRPGLASLRSLVLALQSCVNPLLGQRWLRLPVGPLLRPSSCANPLLGQHWQVPPSEVVLQSLVPSSLGGLFAGCRCRVHPGPRL